ncbi:MAG: hypothetical protein JWM10_1551, partial [Myxococcaceae bacterium]|nr:hypothetical protein [Myxococcaceae bacterium]
MTPMNTRWSWALLVWGLGCSKADNDAAGREAATRAQAHVREGLEATGRLTGGLQAVLASVTPTVVTSIADPIDVARVRNRLRDLHDDRSAAGRQLSLYPTHFVAVVGLDGKGIAGDIEASRDYLPGLDLRAPFACVAAALNGTAGSCTGDFVTMEGAPSRPYMMSAVPLRATAEGPIVGALVGAMTFGRVAQAIRQSLNVSTLRDRVQLAVGFWHGGRLVPSGRDNDVPASMLVPDALLPRVPGNTNARVARGEAFTFTFSENGGAMQWGAAVA